LVTLVGATLARGGLVWGFGLGGGPTRGTPWGRLYPVWRPGTLSNHFYVRLRKTHLLHRLTRTLTPPPRRGRRRGTRLAARWGRLRRSGSTPVGVAPGAHLRKVFPFQGWSTRGFTVAPAGGLGVLGRTPPEGYLRGGHLRRWWRVVPHLGGSLRGNFRPPLGGSWTPRGSTPGGKFTPGVPREDLPGKTIRVNFPPRGGFCRKRHRRGWTPTGVARFQRWPQPFPSLLLGGGPSPWGGTLLNEATSCGVLLVRLEGSEAAPGGVLWNQDPRSLTGVVALVDHLWGRSFRVSLLRTLWGRLSLV